ncbi:NAD(P)-binding protein [Ideonella sp. DXS29W]|uniref:NAD(P)-binding protein n=1 Tax=Ideonella lacteola TaxID=2984193 RepID=A0ABU9BRS3_9BURK
MPWPQITRRDFLNGVALAVPPTLSMAEPENGSGTSGDPIALRTGLQGQTDQVNAVAHAWRDDPGRWQREAAEVDPDIEDLVVVGAGISGLTGAHLFQQHAGRPVRILVLDALDDIGGHARRNEFVSRSGVRLIGYGGSQSLDSPSLFSPAAKQLLSDLGIELTRFKTEFFDKGWAARHGLTQSGLFFGREAWGEDRLVRHGKDDASAAWLARTPLPAAAQSQLAALFDEPRQVLPGLKTAQAVRSALSSMTYRDFLLKAWRADATVVRYFQSETQGYFGVGIDATTALDAWAAGLPGFQGLALGEGPDRRMSPSGRQLMASQDEYIYHFPDGNAGVARALVRSLIPSALPGSGMDALVDATLDRSRLDAADAAVRIRLGATVVGLRHLGPPSQAEFVELRYVDPAGRLRIVRARQVLLACWHRVIARLTDELPRAQVEALNDQVKTPLLYGTVLLNNWRAWQRAGLRGFGVVDGFWGEASLDFPVSMGSQRYAQSPDEPVLLHLSKVVVPGNQAPARVQASQGRAMLMGWDYAHLEGQVRTLLNAALGPFGFEDARDIEAITINRWAHGYAYEYMRPWDRYWPQGPLPCERARQGWGRVAIANADAGAYAYAHSAIDQATRAVQELMPAARLPAWHRIPGPDPQQIGLT